MEYLWFILTPVSISICSLGAIIIAEEVNFKWGIAIFISTTCLFLSSFMLGETLGHKSGINDGMKKASKQCQLSECPYTITDSTSSTTYKLEKTDK
jgi:hypothetical protein